MLEENQLLWLFMVKRELTMLIKLITNNYKYFMAFIIATLGYKQINYK